MPELNNTNINNEAEALNDVSKEELLDLLKNKGFDFKQLAAEAKVAKNLSPNTKSSKKSNVAGYSLEMCDHADFIIKKTTSPKNWKMLVVMPSQGTCFFKDQAGDITPLSDTMLKGFMRGMPRIEIGTWVDYLEGGADEANAILRILNNPTLMEMEKLNIGPAFNHRAEIAYGYNYWVGNKRVRDLYHDYEVAYDLIPQLLKSYPGDRKALDMIVSNKNFFKDLVDTFGIQNARDFVDETKISLAVIDEMDVYSAYNRTRDGHGGNVSSRPNIEMEYKAFKDYILYDSVFMGLAKSLKTFMQDWNDVLKMQKDFFGKIKIKYPKDLLLLHQQLSYKTELIKEQIDEKHFAEQVEKAMEYETTVGNYIFIAPKVKQDFYDEAQQQANCLASYVDRFTNGEDIIMFMRYKDTPEDSLVTIELKGGEVVQKYQARNQHCTEEQNLVIEKWLKKIEDKRAGK